MSFAGELAANWMELLTMVAVHPAGAEALVGSPGKKNWPGIHEYQTLPMDEVALAASLKVRSYVKGPEPELLIVPLATWPCAWTKVAVPNASINPRRILGVALVKQVKGDCDKFFMVFSFFYGLF
jgi:hypothetical protein